MKHLSQILLLLTLILFGCNDDVVQLENNWILQKGWYPDKDLQFKATSKEDTDRVFVFNKNGSIDYTVDNTGATCIVGQFTMREGNWTFDGTYLTLEMKGLVVSDRWYWCIVKYKVELEDDILKLSIFEVIKNRKISPTKTWEELIKEK